MTLSDLKYLVIGAAAVIVGIATWVVVYSVLVSFLLGLCVLGGIAGLFYYLKEKYFG